MRKIICAMMAAGAVYSAVAAPTVRNSKKIYSLPEDAFYSSEQAENVVVYENFSLFGSETGLYKIFENKVAIPLKLGVTFSKIIRTTKVDVDESGNANETEQYYFSTNEGIMTSYDLENFEYRNSGLPFLTIKKYHNGETTFEKQPAQIKDFAVHPENPNIMVTATKDSVFITYDGALNWNSIGSSSRYTAGIKAVAVCNVPKLTASGNETGETEIAVFMSHPIFGLSYYLPEREKPIWNDVNNGLEMMQTMSSPDEISDILCVSEIDAKTGSKKTEIYVSQSFMPRIYRFDWATKRAKLIYSGKEPADTIDGLYWNGHQIVFSRTGALEALTVMDFEPKLFDDESDYPSPLERRTSIPTQYIQWKEAFSYLAPRDTIHCALLNGYDGTEIAPSELWLLKPEVSGNKYFKSASQVKAVYIPANRVCTQQGIDSFKNLLKNNNLNAVVIDMKDDYGLLRYNTKDPLVKEKGFESKFAIDLDNFVRQMKEENIYLIARIVSFKDKNLSEYAGGKYAVWDKANNKPWVGTKGYEEIKNPETGEVTGRRQSYYDENWCDPYSPEVWEYNVAIAKELVSRGFDEIQYDYIRFPTDGLNMKNATYRWQSPGMDKESALISFLKYARENLNVPIGIDIYGANGWYRSGTRTGQDVELLAQYVDVICPMFYPSHFEQSFLNYQPYTERPYRIYYYGTYRNTVIGRNKIIVRPWVQSFYIGVSYDRQYYDKNYVQREVYGVRDSVNTGYMYWNNIGRYDDISPDVNGSEYPWTAMEASKEYRKPALSGGDKLLDATPIKIEMQNANAKNNHENGEPSNEEIAEPKEVTENGEFQNANDDFSILNFSLSNVKIVRKEKKNNEDSQNNAKKVQAETNATEKKSAWPSLKTIKQAFWDLFN